LNGRAIPLLRPDFVRVVALLAAPLVGVLLARHTSTGVAITVALIYIPIVFLNLPLALVLWAPLTFTTGLSFPASGPAVISVLLLAAWIGTWRTAWADRRAVIESQRPLIIAIVLFLVWNAISILWATNSGAGLESLVEWLQAAAIFIVVATSIRDERYVRWMLVAFVIGGVISVVIGVAQGGLHQVGEAANESAAEGRLTGGGTDPNYLGAGLVASTIVAMTLFAAYRQAILRWVLAGAMVILVAGIVASASRGALLAALVGAITAFIVFKRGRLALGAALLLLIGLAAIWIAADPSALTRLTNFSGTGTGRTELWKIAWRVGNNNPVVGVGLGNFAVEAVHYVQRPGALTAVKIVVEEPHVVHNMYLQSFAETGIIGFALLAAFVVIVLRGGFTAGRAFERLGETRLATLSRGVMVAQVSIFVSLIFLTDGTDERFWVLFGVGAALGGLVPSAHRVSARRRSRRRGWQLSAASSPL
jgi:O-Antigen ligase